MPRRARFDFDAAVQKAEASAPLSSSRNSILQHPQIHEWLGKLAARVNARTMTWITARRVLIEACRAEGLPEPRQNHIVIAAYARRHFHRD
jgi:Zn-dependent M32 family carboxypeptidase